MKLLIPHFAFEETEAHYLTQLRSHFLSKSNSLLQTKLGLDPGPMAIWGIEDAVTTPLTFLKLHPFRCSTKISTAGMSTSLPTGFSGTMEVGSVYLHGRSEIPGN